MIYTVIPRHIYRRWRREEPCCTAAWRRADKAGSRRQSYNIIVTMPANAAMNLFEIMSRHSACRIIIGSARRTRHAMRPILIFTGIAGMLLYAHDKIIIHTGLEIYATFGNASSWATVASEWSHCHSTCSLSGNAEAASAVDVCHIVTSYRYHRLEVERRRCIWYWSVWEMPQSLWNVPNISSLKIFREHQPKILMISKILTCDLRRPLYLAILMACVDHKAALLMQVVDEYANSPRRGRRLAGLGHAVLYLRRRFSRAAWSFMSGRHLLCSSMPTAIN